MPDQQHPRAAIDRDIVNRLAREGPSERNLVELARLRIRYGGFPGARDLQRDLDLLLQQWQLDEEQLFAKTRDLYARRQLGQVAIEDATDWS